VGKRVIDQVERRERKREDVSRGVNHSGELTVQGKKKVYLVTAPFGGGRGTTKKGRGTLIGLLNLKGRRIGKGVPVEGGIYCSGEDFHQKPQRGGKK